MRIKVLALLVCAFLMAVTACREQTEPPITGAEATSESSAADQSETAEPPLPESSDEPEPEEISEASDPTVLVAYFSQYAFLEDHARAADGVTSASIAPGDVERIAGMIQNATGADLLEIVAAVPYPANYDETAARARQEAGTRPELAGSVENMERYEVIYIGYPVWAGSFPMPVATLMESYDFSGKILVPFCTHEGFLPEDIWSGLEQIAPGAELVEGYAINLLDARPTAEAIVEWLGEQNLLVTEES